MAEVKIPEFREWAVIELMGHVRIAGLVTEEERFGAKLGRIDIPQGDGFVTQYFNGSSIYRLTPVTEEIARAVAACNQPKPVHRWELRKPELAAGEVDAIDTEAEDDLADRDDDCPL